VPLDFPPSVWQEHPRSARGGIQIGGGGSQGGAILSTRCTSTSLSCFSRPDGQACTREGKCREEGGDSGDVSAAFIKERRSAAGSGARANAAISVDARFVFVHRFDGSCRRCGVCGGERWFCSVAEAAGEALCLSNSSGFRLV